jgi:hypothetical protein
VIVRAGAAALATAGALLVPAGDAAAAALTPARVCYAASERIRLVGTGFTPNVAVTVVGQASPTTDATGTFELAVAAPRVRGLGVRTTRYLAADPASTMPGAATVVAWADVPVVAAAFASNTPLAGRPRTRTTWRFAGFFATGAPIFGHFRTRGRTVRTYRFGLAAGPCGTLAVTAPRLPVARPRPGRWRLKLDQAPTYSARSPGRVIVFRVAPD